jgi:catechol 2,3-dioxygenase-like lactoylglutathione lyase family enzyme
MNVVAISHVGLCVSDLERSQRFYCEGLGFEPGARFEVGAEFGPTLEVAGDVAVTSQFVVRDGCSIELLHYTSPGVHGRPAATRNQLGFTHLCVRVDDVDAVAARLVEHGGTVLDATRYSLALGEGRSNDFVFVADPDGVRVELMKL